jgi:hypothetical protein
MVTPIGADPGFSSLNRMNPVKGYEIFDPFGGKKVKEDFEIFKDMSIDAAHTMQSAFSQAWRDIFGEANSLFEQFMSGVVNSIFNMGANWITGGLFSFVGGLFEKQQVINVNLGNETVERVVVGNIKSAQQKRLL